MNDEAKSMAELAAMRARGEITAEEFEEAKKLLRQPSVSNSEVSGDTKREVIRPIPRPKPKRGCRNVFMGLLLLFGGFIALALVVDSLKTPEQKAEEAAEREAKKKQNAKEQADKAAAKGAEEAENRRKGFHCLSSWDGSHSDFADLVKKSLRDPSSFEHTETRISPVDDKGRHTVIMTFRATNGFGGKNIGMATATIVSSNCAVIGWDMIKS